jgi:hypothetical protein
MTTEGTGLTITPGAALAAAYLRSATAAALHRVMCADESCERCASQRVRWRDRQFEVAGDDEECPECYRMNPPWNITDDVEGIVRA